MPDLATPAKTPDHHPVALGPRTAQRQACVDMQRSSFLAFLNYAKLLTHSLNLANQPVISVVKQAGVVSDKD